MNKVNFLKKVAGYPKAHKKLITLLGIVVLSVIVYWLAGHSTIKLQSSGQNVSYTLYSQGSQKTILNITSSTGEVKKTLPKGNYEVLVSQGDKSYFEVIKTKSFLGTTTVKANLNHLEKSRQFVGGNPSSCLKILADVLISYDCKSKLSALQTYALSESGVSYKVKSDANTSLDGQVEGIVDASKDEGEGNAYAITKVSSGSSTGLSQGHYAYRIDLTLAARRPIELKSLAADKTYSVMPYKDGFVAIDASFNQFFYYSNVNAQSQTLNIAKPNDASLSPRSFDASSGTFLALYSSPKKSEVVLSQNNGQSQHFSFNKAGFSKAGICGEGLLCALKDKALSIYDVSGSKAKFLYSVNNVKDINSSTTGFLIATNKGIINLAAADRTGYLEYSLGDYSFNALYMEKNGYVLALTDSIGQKTALYINQTANNTDSIDKMVAILNSSSSIASASAFGKSIFIQPDYGKPIRSESGRGYTYDPDTVLYANTKIYGLVNTMGLGEAGYYIGGLLPDQSPR